MLEIFFILFYLFVFMIIGCFKIKTNIRKYKNKIETKN